jgi:hypothetical protein
LCFLHFSECAIDSQVKGRAPQYSRVSIQWVCVTEITGLKTAPQYSCVLFQWVCDWTPRLKKKRRHGTAAFK